MSESIKTRKIKIEYVNPGTVKGVRNMTISNINPSITPAQAFDFGLKTMDFSKNTLSDLYIIDTTQVFEGSEK